MAFWKKKRATNRRLKRGSVLDVKLRSDVVRKERIRVLVLTCGVVLGTLAVIASVSWAGRWALNRFGYENPAFAIRRIDLQTSGIVRREQLLAWSGVQPGQNLLALDLRRVKRDIELSPVVRNVTVDRLLPSTLRIRVEEREPLVRVTTLRPSPTGRGLVGMEFQLDPDGYVMSPLESWQTTLPIGGANTHGVPLLMGVKQRDLRPGRRVESRTVLAALELVGEFSVSAMAGLVEIREIDVSSSDALEVTTAQGSRITFALSDIGQQLRRWRAIYDYGMRYNRAIRSLDLSVPDNVPARWINATLQPAAPVKRPPVPKGKNRNV